MCVQFCNYETGDCYYECENGSTNYVEPEDEGPQEAQGGSPYPGYEPNYSYMEGDMECTEWWNYETGDWFTDCKYIERDEEESDDDGPLERLEDAIDEIGEAIEDIEDAIDMYYYEQDFPYYDAREDWSEAMEEQFYSDVQEALDWWSVTGPGIASWLQDSAEAYEQITQERNDRFEE